MFKAKAKPDQSSNKSAPEQAKVMNPAATSARLPAWIGVLASSPLLELDDAVLQPKLEINQPGDVYEQQADRVAEQVMRMPEPPSTLRRCACGDIAGPDGECDACKAK